MKRGILVCFAVALALIAPAVLSVAQVKQHDYTQQNKSIGNKEIQKKRSDLTEKSSSMQDRQFKAKQYNNTKDASALIEKSFYISRDTKSPFSPGDEFSDSRKEFEGKQFNPKTRDWAGSGKMQKLFDTEKNLSRDYKGSIDFNKKTKFSTERVRDAYEGLRQMSMQDINKYQFRRSHPLTPGLKHTRAGGSMTDISQETNSFWGDMLSRKRIDIDVPNASFMGKKKNVVDSHRSEKASKKQPDIPQNKKLQSIEYLDESKSSQYEFLRVPKGMRAKGRAVIKVETDE